MATFRPIAGVPRFHPQHLKVASPVVLRQSAPKALLRPSYTKVPSPSRSSITSRSFETMKRTAAILLAGLALPCVAVPAAMAHDKVGMLTCPNVGHTWHRACPQTTAMGTPSSRRSFRCGLVFMPFVLPSRVYDDTTKNLRLVHAASSNKLAYFGATSVER